jgi:hypothetical protein
MQRPARLDPDPRPCLSAMIPIPITEHSSAHLSPNVATLVARPHAARSVAASVALQAQCQRGRRNDDAHSGEPESRGRERNRLAENRLRGRRRCYDQLAAVIEARPLRTVAAIAVGRCPAGDNRHTSAVAAGDGPGYKRAAPRRGQAGRWCGSQRGADHRHGPTSARWGRHPPEGFRVSVAPAARGGS